MNLVLDMNVLHAAYTGKNPESGDLDPSVMILIGEILNCKHKLWITQDIEKQYQSLFKAQEEKHDPAMINVGRYYNLAKNKEGKIQMRANNSNMLPEISDEKNRRKRNELKDEDVKYARLANTNGAILVTYDGPLMSLFDSSKAKKPSQIVNDQV